MTTPSKDNPPPEQSQEYPGRTGEMGPRPRYSGEVLAPVGGETLPG